MEAPLTRDEPENNRFVMEVDGGEAFATYRRQDNYLVVSHTEVPRAVRGTGLGSQLAEALFRHARENGQRIVPACSFIADWAERHPEYQDVLADADRNARRLCSFNEDRARGQSYGSLQAYSPAGR